MIWKQIGQIKSLRLSLAVLMDSDEGYAFLFFEAVRSISMVEDGSSYSVTMAHLKPQATIRGSRNTKRQKTAELLVVAFSSHRRPVREVLRVSLAEMVS